MKLISLDTETGGIGTDKSLLTVCLIAANEDGSTLLYPDNPLVLKLYPDDLVFHVTAEALGINKLDLQELQANGISYKQAKTVLYRWLETVNPNAVDKLLPVGKNVYFDLLHIWDKLISRKSWEHFCSYRVIELSSIGTYLQSLGQLPADLSGSLASYCEYFKIPLVGQHDCKVDAQANLEVWKAFRKLSKS